MTDTIIATILLSVLLIIDGLLSAIRHAFMNSHPVRLKEFEEEDRRGARRAVRIASDATGLILSINAAQNVLRLITAGTLLVGVIGLARFARMSSLQGWLVILAGGIGISIIEAVAERTALRKPEETALKLAGLAVVFRAVFLPLGRLVFQFSTSLSGSTNKNVYSLVTEEEIMTLVDAGEEGGVIEEDEKAMIYSIFRLDDTLVREIMIPRIDMLAFDETTSLLDATDLFLKTGFSRAPVFSGSIDNIIGLVYSKDLLKAWREHHENRTVEKLLREAYFVPEAKKADDLLTELQVKRIHMAVVVDEYGGTAGIVTMEDIVEEIVGEIRDEYDEAEEMAFQQVGEGEFIFTGGIDIDDVNQLTGAEIPKDTSETLGGFIYSQLGKVPVIGESVNAGGLLLIVEQVSGRRIRKVHAQRTKESSAESNDNGD